MNSKKDFICNRTFEFQNHICRFIAAWIFRHWRRLQRLLRERTARRRRINGCFPRMGFKENTNVCSAFFAVPCMLHASPLSPCAVLAKSMLLIGTCGTDLLFCDERKGCSWPQGWWRAQQNAVCRETVLYKPCSSPERHDFLRMCAVSSSQASALAVSQEESIPSEFCVTLQ